MIRLAVVAGLAALFASSGAQATSNQRCDGRWLTSVVWLSTSGGHWEIHVTPKTRARLFGRLNLAALWREMNACVPPGLKPYPYKGRRDSDSAYAQLRCHASFSAGAFGHYVGGKTWDLETWRNPYVSTATMVAKRCNW